MGHSPQALAILPKYLIGTFAGGDSARPARKVVDADASSSSGAALAKMMQILLPLLVLLAAVLAFQLNPNKAA